MARGTLRSITVTGFVEAAICEGLDAFNVNGNPALRTYNFGLGNETGPNTSERTVLYVFIGDDQIRKIEVTPITQEEMDEEFNG
jgi:hypothetical protein